jgi:FkbM family methyltransferase
LSAALRRRGPAQESPNVWKARAERRAARITKLKSIIDELHQRLEDSNARGSEVRNRLRTQRHATPSSDVLRHMLSVRATHLPISPEDRALADARERRLLDLSTEYRAAIEATPSTAPMQKIDIEGFDWWVPLDPKVEDRVERASRQGFPFRAILQTREVALGGIMLDLGANLGRTSIPRVLLGDVRAVYAAEPFPGNYLALVRNVIEYGLRGFVMPDQVAIGEARGRVDLRVSRFPGGHRLLHNTRRPVESISVEVWPVDEWLSRVGVDPAAVTFVKVDTQGSEVRVLRGATSLTSRPHVAWQIEVDPTLLKRAGTPLRDLCALVESRFTHFIDLAGHHRGARAQSTRELRETLSYLSSGRSKTDLVLYHARAGSEPVVSLTP